jgi:hypothetical protein
MSEPVTREAAEAAVRSKRSSANAMNKANLTDLLSVLCYEEPKGESLSYNQGSQTKTTAPAIVFWNTVAEMLTSKPREWSLVRVFKLTDTPDARSHAVGLKRRIVKHQLKALRLVAGMNDTYESEIRVEDGEYRVYARYMPSDNTTAV